VSEDAELYSLLLLRVLCCRAVLALHRLESLDMRLDQEKYEDAVNVLISFQNTDGGWPTYELKRSGSWFELFNPSEVFGGKNSKTKKP